MTKKRYPPGYRYNKGKGKAYAWIEAHVGYQGNDCIPWPFCSLRGRGMLQYNGKRWYAARLMCQLAHGALPTPDLEATHDCGKGHEGCMNPNHLEWKTQAENCADRKVHGTEVRPTWGFKGRLTEQQVQYVRDMRGQKSQRKLAAELGVSLSCISQILTGRSRRPVSKMNYFKPEEDAKIKELGAQGKNFSQIARALSRGSPTVARRAAKLGVKSSYAPWPKGTDTTKLELL